MFPFLFIFFIVFFLSKELFFFDEEFLVVMSFFTIFFFLVNATSSLISNELSSRISSMHTQFEGLYILRRNLYLNVLNYYKNRTNNLFLRLQSFFSIFFKQFSTIFTQRANFIYFYFYKLILQSLNNCLVTEINYLKKNLVEFLKSNNKNNFFKVVSLLILSKN